MTTVLADARLGVMVSDSAINDGSRLWLGPKVFRIRGALLGFAGETHIREGFMKWWREGALVAETPTFKGGIALVLTPDRKLLYFEEDKWMETLRNGREAIGTGSQAAMAAYEALDWKDPKKAVRIACHHDHQSRAPVRAYNLKAPA